MMGIYYFPGVHSSNQIKTFLNFHLYLAYLNISYLTIYAQVKYSLNFLSQQMNVCLIQRYLRSVIHFIHKPGSEWTMTDKLINCQDMSYKVGKILRPLPCLRNRWIHFTSTGSCIHVNVFIYEIFKFDLKQKMELFKTYHFSVNS